MRVPVENTVVRRLNEILFHPYGDDNPEKLRQKEDRVRVDIYEIFFICMAIGVSSYDNIVNGFGWIGMLIFKARAYDYHVKELARLKAELGIDPPENEKCLTQMDS